MLWGINFCCHMDCLSSIESKKSNNKKNVDRFLFRSFDPSQKCPVSCYVKKLEPGVIEEYPKSQLPIFSFDL